MRDDECCQKCKPCFITMSDRHSREPDKCYTSCLDTLGNCVLLHPSTLLLLVLSCIQRIFIFSSFLQGLSITCRHVPPFFKQKHNLSCTTQVNKPVLQIFISFQVPLSTLNLKKQYSSRLKFKTMNNNGCQIYIYSNHFTINSN